MMETIRDNAAFDKACKLMVSRCSSLRYGIVKCRYCGKITKVDSAHCLHYGWPKCCGKTMTLQEPED